ncbi:hypothetical protein [Enemella evansiae]|uniref:hypothetical protein n=1 Tax=Enemella evansiae TaxID=2016499 RepID=UPI00117E1304|nr:hypothetical protein [Enemella evansiae]
MSNRFRWAILAALIVICLCGLGTVGWAIVRQRGDLAAPGAAMVAAAVAGSVTITATSTWREQRAEALAMSVQTERQSVYASLAAHLMQRFGGSGNVTALGEIRAKVATWAAPEVLRALGEWNEAYDQVTRDLSPNEAGMLTLDPDHGALLRHRTSDLVAAMRNELHPKSPTSSEQVERAMFNFD